MVKKIHRIKEFQPEFQKVFSGLCSSRSAWQAWSDFVDVTAIGIANQVDLRPAVWQDREKHCLTIMEQYSERERQIFPELFKILTMALQRSQEQDFLGDMFMAMELGSHWHGQFFTPYDVCKAMAQITTDQANAKTIVEEKGYVSVNDPACGAGATLIAARNALELMGIGGSSAFFVGQDISRVAGLMCYIQLSLIGCAGYVIIADTLLYPLTGPLLTPNLRPEQDAWFMPMNVLDPAWVLRSMGRTWPKPEQKEEIRNKSPQSETKPPETVTTAPAPIPMTESEGGQLTLF